jgi:hypothetical protein
MATPDRYHGAPESLFPVLDLAKVTALSPNGMSVSELGSTRTRARDNELLVLEDLCTRPESWIVLSEEPVRSRLPKETLVQIGPNQWKISLRAKVQVVYREILFMGGWLLLTGGHAIALDDIRRTPVHTIEGLKHLLGVSESQMIISSLEDDLEWLVCWS